MHRARTALKAKGGRPHTKPRQSAARYDIARCGFQPNAGAIDSGRSPMHHLVTATAEALRDGPLSCSIVLLNLVVERLGVHGIAGDAVAHFHARAVLRDFLDFHDDEGVDRVAGPEFGLKVFLVVLCEE